MKNDWNEAEASLLTDELDLRVYSSRLLGRNSELVLHGGGNTSVKITEKNILGDEERLLYVKGSGWDLESIDRAGFAPVQLDHLLALAKLDSLSDPDMVNQLKTHVTLANAPTPSVETILHASLPYKFVDHTHADAVISITNTPNAVERIKEIYKEQVVIIPYVMPGFDLAKLCAEKFTEEKTNKTIGMILMNHGVFSFAETARESYNRMITLVNLAEDYLKKNNAWDVSAIPAATVEILSPARMISELSQLRQSIAIQIGYPIILQTHCDNRTQSFAGRGDLSSISQQGPATPDHVIRTKRVPMLGRNVASYAKDYQSYFNANLNKSNQQVTMLDPAPRVVLDKQFGMATVGRSAKDASIVRDIYMHTMDIIERSVKLDRFKALAASDIFAVEYWDLEQAKLKKSGSTPVFAGEVAIVTGAASGIGKACVDSLLARGAAVVGLDIDLRIETLHARSDFLGLRCDVVNEDQIQKALHYAVKRFGGVDILILNAGIFPASAKIDNMDMTQWQKTLDVNLSANLNLMRILHPILKLAIKGGRVAVIGSKNVSAPGPGAAAYSASKAALHQLVRVAALEWGADNIRINEVHPNAVFDTGIWTDAVLKSRAESYGLTIEEYKTRNIMKVEVTSHDVAELAVELCGPLFSKTLAAQIPVDGGDDRVI